MGGAGGAGRDGRTVGPLAETGVYRESNERHHSRWGRSLISHRVTPIHLPGDMNVTESK